MRKTALTLLLVLLVCAAAAQLESRPSMRLQEQVLLNTGERDSVITELKSLYGQSLDKTAPIFAITQDFVLAPTFSTDGLLIQFAIEPRDKWNPYHGKDPRQQMQLSPAEFELLLWKLNSIKALGPLEEEDPIHIVVGLRGNNKRYQNAYLTTSELLRPPGEPPPIQYAYVYYLHRVTGVPMISKDSRRLENADSFNLLCVDGKLYFAPKAEYLEIWSKRNLLQTLNLAGPTRAGACEN